MPDASQPLQPGPNPLNPNNGQGGYETTTNHIPSGPQEETLSYTHGYAYDHYLPSATPHQALAPTVPVQPQGPPIHPDAHAFFPESTPSATAHFRPIVPSQNPSCQRPETVQKEAIGIGRTTHYATHPIVQPTPNPPQSHVNQTSSPHELHPMPQTKDREGASRPRKRPRGEYEDKQVDESREPSRNVHSLPEALAFSDRVLGKQPAMNDELVHATRQLSQPRRTPSRSSHQGSSRSTVGADKDHEVDEPGNDLQSEHEEITRTLYEEDTENGAGLNHLVRLVSRMAEKQDAIYRSLGYIRRQRNGAKDSSTRPINSNTNETEQPRPSPPQPPKKVNWDQSVPCTEPAGRRPRDIRRVRMSDAIRRSVQRLCKQADPESCFPVPAPETVNYPSEEEFYLRYNETRKSTFNRMAANIIIEKVKRDFSEELEFTEEVLHRLASMVSEHIRYLIRCYKNSQCDDAEDLRKQRLKRASAASRRNTLYHNRLTVVDRFPKALGKHRLLIVTLGLAGTSSDEEDSEQPGVYKIRRRVELSTRVQVLKRKLDLLYNLYYKGPGTRGSQTHLRQPSELVSSRPLQVEGLPITCLSHAWLKNLSEPEREFYQFVPHQYNYSFPEVLIQRFLPPSPYDITLSEDEDEDGDGDEDEDEDGGNKMDDVNGEGSWGGSGETNEEQMEVEEVEEVGGEENGEAHEEYEDEL